MCNCGSKRVSLSRHEMNRPLRSDVIMPGKINKDVNFRYRGNTSLTAVGSVTGKHYLFQKTGDIVLIDYRDSKGMLAVPSLEKLLPELPK